MSRAQNLRTPAAPLAETIAGAISHRGGIYLGTGKTGALYAPPEHGTLALGPPRSGKTSAIVIPNVLCAPGSVVVVSTKRDVIDATALARSALGEILLFDLGGLGHLPSSVRRVGWSPLEAARSWDGAVLVAESMVGASRNGAHRGEALHWNERASALLSALFHGAALAHLSLRDVVGAINRHEAEIVLHVLARNAALGALDLLAGILATDHREQSGIWSTASSVLAAYRTTAALESAELPPLDARRLVRERTTLYVVASSELQAHVAPLVAGLLREVRTAAYQLNSETALFAPNGRRTPNVLFVLDELANIAPLHDLPVLVAEGASQGVVTLACLQDLSQARSRWGVAADGFMSLFGTKVALGGIGDVTTLDAISRLAGEHDTPTVSKSTQSRLRTRGVRSSRTTGSRRERRLPIDAIACPAPGTALVIIGAVPGHIHLTPYYALAPWCDAVAPGVPSGGITPAGTKTRLRRIRNAAHA